MKNTNLTRRHFFKNSFTGLASAALLPRLFQNSEGKDKKGDKIIYRALGKTGLKLPIVSMGSYMSPNLVNTALDMGIVHIDTSAEYNNGNHERMLGKIFKDRPRDSFIIATSFGTWNHTDRGEKQFRAGTTEKPLIKSFEASLQRLGLDYVDIYHIAGINSRESTLFEPFLKTVVKFKKEGKIRFIGVATHENEPEVIKAAIESQIYDVVLSAYNFRQKHRDQVKHAIAEATKAGLGVVAMKTQAGVYWDKERKHMINMKAALKWVLQDTNVHTAIPGFSSFEEMKEGMSVMENLSFTAKEKADLELGEKYSYNGLYCQQCGKCISQCPQQIDIPTLMRCYMYAYGYKNLAKAKETISQLKINDYPCAHCSSCSVHCTNGFNIRERICDIMRLKDVPEEFLV